MCHPSRLDLAHALRRKLANGRRDRTVIDLVVDPDPDADRNPWRTARLAWARTPPGYTHRLVLQEDVVPCPRLLYHVRRALRAKPDRIASFTWRSLLVADAQGAHWVQGFPNSWVPALALAIPTHLVPSLVEYDDGSRPVADDDVYGRWTREHGLPWYATIPSLVDHDDDAPSLMRDPYARGERRAACPIGLTDPGLIDWTRD
jgi:hypothetical protein